MELKEGATNSRDEILEIVEQFFAELYTIKHACDLASKVEKREW